MSPFLYIDMSNGALQLDSLSSTSGHFLKIGMLNCWNILINIQCFENHFVYDYFLISRALVITNRTNIIKLAWVLKATIISKQYLTAAFYVFDDCGPL